MKRGGGGLIEKLVRRVVVKSAETKSVIVCFFI